MPKCCDCENEAMVGTNKKTTMPYKRCKPCADIARAKFKATIQASVEARGNLLERFAEIWGAACLAGEMAGKACTPVAMVVGSPSTPLGNDIDPNQPTYFVDDGVCGFAAVNVSPANCAFANWLKKTDKGRYDSYQGVVSYWIHDYNQSMTRKEAHARAMSKYLNEHLEELQGTGKRAPCIRAWSRMD